MENALEKRLTALENLVCALADSGTTDLKLNCLDDAKTQALWTMVQELAVNAGLSEDEFLKHYEARFRWWHDYYLRRVEDSSPAVAARLDDRTSEQAAVDATYPPMFDPPPSEQK